MLEKVDLGRCFDGLRLKGVNSVMDLANASSRNMPNSLFTSPEVGMTLPEVERLTSTIQERLRREEASAANEAREWEKEKRRISVADKHGPSNLDYFSRARRQQSIIVRQGTAVAQSVRDEDYLGGEADCIRANYGAATLTWPELCGEVTESGDTIFNFDTEVCEQLFNVIDEDGSGRLSEEEILRAGEKPAVVEYVRRSNQPTLEHLVHHDRASKKAEMQILGIRTAFLIVVDTNGTAS